MLTGVKNKMIKLRTIFAGFFLVVFTQVGCAVNDGATYEAEAQALCNVFSPDFWSSVPSEMQPIEKQQLLSDRISQAVQSPEMKALIEKLPSLTPSERYSHYLMRIQELSGKKQACPAIKDYFSF